jgi:hypothetical protein
MKLKHKIGEDVVIKVSNIVGIVVSVLLTQKESKYEVTFPDADGLPCSRYFYDIELLPVDTTNKVGFGGLSYND